MEHIIDATGKKLGRVATEAAMVLRGKTSPSYEPHRLAESTVHITNASHIDLSDAKLAEPYLRYTGYPGGLKSETRGHLIERLGYAPIFEKAIRGMLPRNTLRNEMMKHLKITE